MSRIPSMMTAIARRNTPTGSMASSSQRLPAERRLYACAAARACLGGAGLDLRQLRLDPRPLLDQAAELRVAAGDRLRIGANLFVDLAQPRREAGPLLLRRGGGLGHAR